MGRRRPSAALILQSFIGLGDDVAGPSATDSGTFPNTSHNGSLLVLVAAAMSDSGLPTISAPLTAGMIWTLAVTGNSVGGPFARRVVIYYSRNSPSIASGTVWQITATRVGATETAIQACIFEFGPCDGTLDQTASNSGTSSVPATANLITTAKDVIVCGEVGNSTTIAGAGYTLGPSLPNTPAQGSTQYQLNIASGSIPTAFGSSVAFWAEAAAAFKV